MFGRGILWRSLGMPFKLGPIDGRAVFFILIAAYHWALWTLILGIVGVAFLFWAQRIGYSLPNLARRGWVLLAGSHRPNQNSRILRSDS